jgi:hypothetical protein
MVRQRQSAEENLISPGSSKTGADLRRQEAELLAGSTLRRAVL